MGNRRELEEQVAREEDRLAALAQELEKQREIVASLKTKLDLAEPQRSETITKPAPAKSSSGLSTIEKVRLFRSLFRGREDVFPRRWENAKTGRSGYAPACNNEWVQRLCAKLGSGGRRTSGSVCGECKSLLRKAGLG